MALQDQLETVLAEFMRKAPPGRHALNEASINDLRARFVKENAVGVGAQAPDFSLPNHKGETVSLSDVLGKGPAVVTFYRGGWCPYCNVQLRAYQAMLPQMTALGARLMAISPQLPDGSLSTAEANQLTFDVLSDLGNKAARSFGVVWSLPEELRAAMRAGNRDITLANGDDSWELPIPGTFVIARGGRVVLAAIEVDYRKRLEPDAILTALRTP